MPKGNTSIAANSPQILRFIYFHISGQNSCARSEGRKFILEKLSIYDGIGTVKVVLVKHLYHRKANVLSVQE